jgi:hypothetical protein
MELLVKPEILTLYNIYIYIYKLSCGTSVCKHFASYQGYPNYGWDLIRYAKGQSLRMALRIVLLLCQRAGKLLQLLLSSCWIVCDDKSTS